MAATIVKKDAGGGWIECVVGTDDNTGVDAKHTQKTTIVIARINRLAYDALNAQGQTEVRNTTIQELIDASFN